MKKRILIIEDNYYKFFTTKQILESKLRLPIRVITAESEADLVKETKDLNPHVVMYRPDGGVVELLDTMKRRKVNRLNSEIVLMVTAEYEDLARRNVEDFVEGYARIESPSTSREATQAA